MSIEDVISEKVESAVLAALSKYLKPIQKREVLTLTQLADEWQCSTQAILNWTRRPSYALPCHYLGSDPRFHRNEFERWSREEALRRLASKTAPALKS